MSRKSNKIERLELTLFHPGRLYKLNLNTAELIYSVLNIE